MKTAIMIDTNSGISLDEGASLGLFVIPMPVIVDEQEYTEYLDITHAELFAQIMAKKDVKTSQPSPGMLTDMWDSIFELGYDEIVYIPMSSGLSSSCSTATVLAEDYDGKVQVADNHRISVTLRDAAMEAREMALQGKSAKEIREELEARAEDSFIFLGVDSLRLFRKNGRISAASAAIATALNLKPILACRGGKFESEAKARGNKQCQAKILECVRNELATRFADVPMSDIRIGTACTFIKQEDADAWRDYVQSQFPEVDVYYDPLSCSIACHTDVNAVGIGVSVHRH